MPGQQFPMAIQQGGFLQPVILVSPPQQQIPVVYQPQWQPLQPLPAGPGPSPAVVLAYPQPQTIASVIQVPSQAAQVVSPEDEGRQT